MKEVKLETGEKGYFLTPQEKQKLDMIFENLSNYTFEELIQ